MRMQSAFDFNYDPEIFGVLFFTQEKKDVSVT